MNKIKRNITIGLIACVALTATLANSACATASMENEVQTAAESVIITTNNVEVWYTNANNGLNCRKEPTAEANNIIKVYPKGSELQIIGIDATGKWWETWDGEMQGWCHSSYLVHSKEELDKQTNASGGTSGTYLGTFKITHYCPGVCCNGAYGNHTAWAGEIIPGQTIAVDPSVIGKLKWVNIKGYGLRRAEDCGGDIKGNHIDLAVPTHQMALDMGVVYRDVYLAE